MVIGENEEMWDLRRRMDYWLYPLYSMAFTVAIWSLVSLVTILHGVALDKKSRNSVQVAHG